MYEHNSLGGENVWRKKELEKLQEEQKAELL